MGRNYHNNDNFAKDFSKEVVKVGSIKGLAGAVGMPDATDWQNIRNMIKLYRKTTISLYGFDMLLDCVTKARQEYQETGRDYSHGKFNLVNKDSGMRYHFEFPESFVSYIQKAYPLMFTDAQHYHWFVKNFSDLRISEKF